MSRTIGNLFLPLIKTVLPYINALVIAVQRLFSWLGNLMGIDMSGISTSIGGADMGDILDQTDDLASGLGDAKKQADKLNKSLRQFDELKVISTKQDEGTAGGTGGISGGLLDAAFEDAFSEYQKVWDEAFGNLENRAQELADKIEKVFEPIKKIIQDFAVGDFFQAGKDVSALVVSITDFFAKAIDKVNWRGIGKKIGDFLAGIDWFAILKSVGNLIWQALKAAFELYVGAFDAAPLETAVISLVAFPKLLKSITSSKFITGIGKLWKNFKTWGEKIKLVTGALAGNDAAASGLAMLYPELSSKVDGVKGAFSNFFSSVKNNGFWKTVDSGITNIRNNLGGLQKAAIVAVAGFAEFSVVSDSVKNLTLGTENWLAEIGKIAGVVAAAGAAMYVALGPAGLVIGGITGVAAAIKGINDAFDEMTEEFVNSVVFDNVGTSINTIAENVSNLINVTGTSSETMQNFSQKFAEIKGNIDEASDSIEEYRITLEREGTLSEEEIGGMKGSIDQLVNALKNDLKLNTNLAFETFMRLSGETATQLGVDVETMTGILSQFQTRFNGIYDGMKAEADTLMDKMLAGTATEEDISNLQSLLDDVEYLSGDAIKRQVELQNAMADMLEIDFGSVEETTAAIQSIKESGLQKMSELDSYYEELTTQVSVWQEQVKRALEIGKISEEEANSYFDIFGKLSDTYAENWENEKAQIETQINTAYEYIKTQLELEGVKVYEEAEKRNLGFWESIFRPHKDTDAVKKFTKDIYTPVIDSINAAKEEINPNAELMGVEMMDNFGESIENYESLPSDFKDNALNCVKGFANEIINNAKIAEEAMKLLFGDAVVGTARDITEVHSPSRVFEEIAEYVVAGFDKGINSGISRSKATVSSWMSDIAGVFSGWIVKTKENFGTWSEDTSDGFSVWSSNTAKKFSEWGTQSKEKISRFNQESKGILSSWNTETTAKIEGWKNTNLGKVNTWSENTKGNLANWKTDTQSTFESWKNTTSGSVERWSADIEGKFRQWNANTTNSTSSWYENMQTFFTENKWNFSGIGQGLQNAFNAAIESVKGIWNTFANWLNDKLTWNIDPIKILGKTVFEGTTISLGKIPTFAVGGFPEDGLFYANHGELVGEFSNGRTAVANNDQIISGIAEGIYPAVYNAVASAMGNNALLREQNELLRGILEKPTIGQDDIGRNAVKYIRGEERRLQKSLIGIY